MKHYLDTFLSIISSSLNKYWVFLAGRGYDWAHQECVRIFLQMSGVEQAIKSWTKTKEVWAQSCAKSPDCSVI